MIHRHWWKPFAGLALVAVVAGTVWLWAPLLFGYLLWLGVAEPIWRAATDAA
jgi:hypothetical protein